MPDDLDYEWLESLLARPGEWTADDLATVDSIIENQRRALEQMHPLDVKGRLVAQGVIDELVAARAAHLGAPPA